MAKKYIKQEKDLSVDALHSRYKNKYEPKFKRRKHKDDLRINSVEILYSNNELQELKNITNGRHLSIFVREASLKAVIIENNKPSITDQHSLGQLKRIGNNINQILKQINTFKKDSYFQQHVKDLQTFLDELRSIYIKF